MLLNFSFWHEVPKNTKKAVTEEEAFGLDIIGFLAFLACFVAGEIGFEEALLGSIIGFRF